MTRTPIDFVKGDEEQTAEEEMNTKIISLEPNHTHFILVRIYRVWTLL